MPIEPDILSVAREALKECQFEACPNDPGCSKACRLAQAVIDLSAQLREVREWYAECIEARKK